MLTTEQAKRERRIRKDPEALADLARVVRERTGNRCPECGSTDTGETCRADVWASYACLDCGFIWDAVSVTSGEGP